MKDVNLYQKLYYHKNIEKKRAQSRANLLKPSNRKRRTLYMRRWRAKNADWVKVYMKKVHMQRMAMGTVKKAILSGKLIKTRCEVCGEEKVEGHHYMGYEKENWLEVKWLCRLHHMENHRKK